MRAGRAGLLWASLGALLWSMPARAAAGPDMEAAALPASCQSLDPDRLLARAPEDENLRALAVAAGCQLEASIRQLQELRDPELGISVTAMKQRLRVAEQRVRAYYPYGVRDSLLARELDPAQAIAERLVALELPYRQAAQRIVALSGHYGLFAGPAYSLEGSGIWDPGFEVLLQFENEAWMLKDPKGSQNRMFRAFCLSAWTSWCRRFTDISYQTIGAIDSLGEAFGGDGGGGSGGDGGTLPLDPDDLLGGGDAGGSPDLAGGGVAGPANPFVKAGGYFRINSGVKAHFTDWIGLAYGAGLSSQPDTLERDVKLVPRGFIGLNLMTLFADGALSQMFVGYAYDQFWEYEERRESVEFGSETRRVKDYDRIVVDGSFTLPGVRALGLGLVGRLYADTPVHGEGPSEVRASLLVHQYFENLHKLFAPLRLIRTAAGSLLE